jgi:hypothetical protein
VFMLHVFTPRTLTVPFGPFHIHPKLYNIFCDQRHHQNRCRIPATDLPKTSWAFVSMHGTKYLWNNPSGPNKKL